MRDGRKLDERVEPVTVTNAGGAGNFIVLCDHASNHVPSTFGTLGLAPGDLERHTAWDPGALPVAARLADLLDAPLAHSRISRLIIDCNRPLDAHDLIAAVSETTPIPGNEGLTAEARQHRITLAHEPYHAAIEGLIDERLAAGMGCQLIAVHSFTPIYRGRSRPWHVGIVHDADERLSQPLITALSMEPGLEVGDNEPYSPADRVYYTLERHGRARGLPCVMVELRNDEIADDTAQRRWSDLLARLLRKVGTRGAGQSHAPVRTGVKGEV